MNTTFFKDIFGFGEIPNTGVSYIASALQISEFRLFEIAYFKWFGEHISDKKLDLHFTHYLENDTAPFWVNDFVRKAKAKFDAGNLNPADYGIITPKSNTHKKIVGWIIIVLLSVFMIIYCYFLPRSLSY